MNRPKRICKNCATEFFAKRGRPYEDQHFCKQECGYEFRATDPDYIKARFQKNCEKQQSGCIHWTGDKNDLGYGRISVGNKSIKAHRLSYLLFKGDIQENMCVCHTCDNPKCVNPDHLFLGTMADNTRDMMKKGRGADGRNSPTGSSHPKSKLTIDDAIYIYRSQEPYRAIREKFGISDALISGIKRGRNWRKEIQSAISTST